LTISLVELLTDGRQGNVLTNWFKCNAIRYDTIEEFNVDSKAEYSA